jgi:nicotinamide-nucleotide amidase
MPEPPPHATAAILAIGDELTTGAALDTNSQRIAARLADVAIAVTEHATISDNPHAVRNALERLAADNDLIVCTGGLGPTADDLTRDALAHLLGDRLVRDDEQHARLKAHYERRNRVLHDGADRQSLRPESASMLTNHHGTAPGIVATLDRPARRTDIALLPGPPNEMLPMLEEQLLPTLRRATDRVIRSRSIQHFGIAESDAARLLGDILRRDRNPLVGVTASDGVITTRIRYDGPHGPSETSLDSADAAIAEKLGRFRVGVDSGTLPHQLKGALERANAALLTAESCTGGELSELFSRSAGVSRVFLGGWITYSNAHKVAHLGVDPELIRREGAVSAAVAKQMAAGALANASDPDIPVQRVHAVAITGIAGPGGAVRDTPSGDPVKPVGTVFIAHAQAPVTEGAIRPEEASTDVRRFEFPGDRARVRRRAATTAAAMTLFHTEQRTLPDPMLWQVPLDHRSPDNKTRTTNTNERVTPQ